MARVKPDGVVAPQARLDFLDALRGVGAVAVFVQHAGETLFGGVKDVTTYGFQLGHFGVLVFFLCSGFIIPSSLERQNSLRRFWTTRVFRLYPLYWFSLVAVLALAAADLYRLPASFHARPGISILGNATMLEKFLGIPYALPLYWTLTYEMMFYATVSGLFVFGLSRKTMSIAAWSCLGSVVLVSLARLAGVEAPLGVLMSLPTMFVGTAIYRYYSGEASGRAVSGVVTGALVTTVVVVTAAFLGRDDPARLGTHSFWPMLTAWLGAYATFGLAFFGRAWRLPRALTYLGKISYSIYLVHPFALKIVPATGNRWLTALIWSIAMVGLSAVTYHAIEEPFIRLGRRLMARGKRTAPLYQVTSAPQQLMPPAVSP